MNIRSLMRRQPEVDPFNWMQRSMRDLLGDPLWAPLWAEETGNLKFLPEIEVSEDERAYHVHAELPGIDPKEVELRILGDTLTIKGEKHEEHEERGKNVHRMERRFGTFQRAITLSHEIDADKVTAKFKNGVLHVTLAKTPEAQRATRRIDIRTE